METKRFVRQYTKVEALVAGDLAKWVAGENPGPQETVHYAAGDVLEVEKDTEVMSPDGKKVIVSGVAASLVRNKVAKFLDPKEAKHFEQMERARLGDSLYEHLQALPRVNQGTGNFLNDLEWAEALKLQTSKFTGSQPVFEPKVT